MKRAGDPGASGPSGEQPADNTRETADSANKILLGHGSGGRMTQELIAQHFLPRLRNPILDAMQDSAVLDGFALTTDAYVVSPRFFPGGDLGRLAICGTVNDLAMVGAEPLGLSAAFILEEGLPIEELERVVASMAAAASEAGVQVVAGDTKVVPRGACDGMFVTTSGVGRVSASFAPSPARVRAGDAVICSGTIADHGIAVMACREGLRLGGDLRSDVAPLWDLVRTLRDGGLDVHALRDPTRGGIAQSLLEMAGTAGLRIVLEEEAIPTKRGVRSACELLGLDPLYVANEGKVLVLCAEPDAEAVLATLRQHALGRDAALIGHVEEGRSGCEVRTALGARRSLRMATGELLPRIC